MVGAFTPTVIVVVLSYLMVSIASKHWKEKINGRRKLAIVKSKFSTSKKNRNLNLEWKNSYKNFINLSKVFYIKRSFPLNVMFFRNSALNLSPNINNYQKSYNFNSDLMDEGEYNNSMWKFLPNKSIKFLCLVLVFQVLLRIPFLITRSLRLLSCSTCDNTKTLIADSFGTLFQIFTVMVNPFIFTLMNRQFRKALIAICRCCRT